jgi:hypothetical protein
MAMEAVAYTFAGLAGVFLSKAVHKYAIDSDPMVSLLVSVAGMLGIALALLVAGALWEGLLATHLVGLVI